MITKSSPPSGNLSSIKWSSFYDFHIFNVLKTICCSGSVWLLSPRRKSSQVTFGFLYHDHDGEQHLPRCHCATDEASLMHHYPSLNRFRCIFAILWRLFHSISLRSIACLSFATPITYSFAMYLSNRNTTIIRRFHGMKLLDLSSSINSVSWSIFVQDRSS